ncbi:MAG: phosphatidylglycerophosphatase A [Pyrinomonadaceae bacterium]
MAVNESSDELNPTVVTADASVARPGNVRSAKDYLALAIATCGVGYLPLAPGTWGSLVGIGCYLLLRYLVVKLFPAAPLRNLGIDPDEFLIFLFQFILLLVVVSISIIGSWAATRVEKISQRKDPGIVVIDEVAGQMLTFFIVLDFLEPRWILLGFILFRIFDIVKPYPARRFEALPGGLGVMGDDLIAGLYATWILAAVMIISRLI